MQTFSFKGALCPVTLGVLLAVYGGIAYAADESVQFNTDVLDVKDRANIDLERFSRAGYLMPGSYQMLLRVNKTELPEQTVVFMAPPDNPKGSMACLTPEQVKLFGLKDEALKGASWWNNGQCLVPDSLPGMAIQPDLGSGALYINVPQAYLEYTAENWDPPSRWDNGVPGVLFDYNLNAMNTHQSGSGSDRSVSGNGTTGGNVGPWRFRADWQAQYSHDSGNSDSGSQQSWDWSRYYAYRAITSLRAKMVLGENYLNSSIFDSFRFTGVSLSTDDNQLPPNLRGYAPEVVGVARTNARVTITQQDRIIYQTTVASGPFRIQDLSSAVSGKLDVKVEEQDGSVSTFQVDTANVPYLTRPGLVRYKIAGGKPSDYDHHTQGPEFMTGEFSWGVNSGWSLYGGSLLAGDYNAASLGIGRDLLALGALSFDITQSRAELSDQGTKSGGSYRVSYSKRFDEYDSQVTFAGYRFAQRDYMSMTQYLNARYGDNGYDSGDNQKELYTITLNKQFRPIKASVYLNYSHQTYWGRQSSDTWNLSVSNYFDISRFKNVSLSLSAYRSQYDNSNDDGIYLSLSLPWGDGGTLSYNGQYSGGDATNTVGYYGRIDDNNDYRINAGTTADGRGTGNGYFTHDGDLASITANASFTGSDYSATGLSMQGGMTATAHGAALHRTNTSGGTRMMVDTEGVSNVPVRGGYGGITRTNLFGKAVVSDISSYYRSDVTVDLESLPENVDATRSVVQGTLTEGAIGYRKFGILAGEKSMAVIKLADGSSPPFGATVSNDDGAQTGIIGDAGSVWLAGLRPGEEMNVRWGSDAQCHINLPSPLPPPSSTLLLPCQTKDRGVRAASKPL
ncbi:outer membrane usher protein [Enterobacter sichuanensis]|uniref:outer membrane usher protein n=1 Tax=Enterobacter sichuanensis TaxID=2071710 RepID=UPI00217D7892|nr:outer membrane usher protein [Enterobacter sichuanensis]